LIISHLAELFKGASTPPIFVSVLHDKHVGEAASGQRSSAFYSASTGWF